MARWYRLAPGRSRGLGDVLVQDREGHVAQQRGKNRPLRGTGVVSPSARVLTEDARLEERLHQSQDAFVPDAFPHPIHQGRMRDFVEAGFDVALHDPLVGAGRRNGAPRPPRHGSGGSGGRVARGISAPGSHRSRRNRLQLPGSCHPDHQTAGADAVHFQCANIRGYRWTIPRQHRNAFVFARSRLYLLRIQRIK